MKSFSASKYIIFLFKFLIKYLLNQSISYKDFREPFDSIKKYDYTLVHYEILAYRLIFLIVFEV